MLVIGRIHCHHCKHVELCRVATDAAADVACSGRMTGHVSVGSVVVLMADVVVVAVVDVVGVVVAGRKGEGHLKHWLSMSTIGVFCLHLNKIIAVLKIAQVRRERREN